MKRIIFLVAVLAFVLAGPALAQSDEEFCAIPEGCDLDGDGTAETPAGTPVPAGPTEDQYGPGEEFCAIPEGCDASATPDPADEGPASPEPTDGGPASPDPADSAPATPAPPDESPSSPGTPETVASPPAEEGGTSADSTEAASPAKEGAKGGPGSETPGASAPSAGKGSSVAGLTVLPETGGASPMVPILGVLLVAGGLLVRRMDR